MRVWLYRYDSTIFTYATDSFQDKDLKADNIPVDRIGNKCFSIYKGRDLYCFN